MLRRDGDRLLPTLPWQASEGGEAFAQLREAITEIVDALMEVQRL